MVSLGGYMTTLFYDDDLEETIGLFFAPLVISNRSSLHASGDGDMGTAYTVRRLVHGVLVGLERDKTQDERAMVAGTYPHGSQSRLLTMKYTRRLCRKAMDGFQLID